MGSFSDYLEKELLDHVFQVGSYSQPALWVGLCTTAPNDASTGSDIAEPTGGAYARVQCTTWDTAAGTTASVVNTAAITFAQATASWGQIVAFAVIDASTAGNMLVHGTVATAKTVDSGDTAQYAAGDLKVTLD